MIKSMENTDQDDFFDFLRSEAPPLAADHDYILKPSKLTSGLVSDSLIDPFVKTEPQKKGRGTRA